MGHGKQSRTGYGRWCVSPRDATRTRQPGVIDARTVRGAATITSATRGYDAGKKISGRKMFGVVDTIGLLIAVSVVAACVSDNVGGIAVMGLVPSKTARFAKVWCDAGFKNAFALYCRQHHISAETVNRIHPTGFHVLPRRWVASGLGRG